MASLAIASKAPATPVNMVEMAKITVRAPWVLKPRKRTRCSFSRTASASRPIGVRVKAQRHHVEAATQASVR